MTREWPPPRMAAFQALLWLASGLLHRLHRAADAATGGDFIPVQHGSAASDAEVRNAIVLSLQDAAITAVIATVLGVPLAYLLAQRRMPAPGLVQAIVDLPLAVPHTVAGIALLFLLGRTGWVGAPAGHLGVSFYGSQWGIVAAMLFVSAPFAVNAPESPSNRSIPISNALPAVWVLPVRMPFAGSPWPWVPEACSPAQCSSMRVRSPSSGRS